MSHQAAAIAARMRSAGKRKQRIGTATNVAPEPKAKQRNVQSKVDVRPFTSGLLGLGVLSVPPKPVKR